MPDYVGLLKFSGPKLGEQQLAADDIARELARAGDIEARGEAVADPGLGGGTFIGVLWTKGDFDMVFIFHGREDSNPEKLYQRLAEKTGSTVTVVPVVTEAQKQRVVAGKPI